ncbi:MAG: M42 family peptidase, partial [Solobacterium sp.]|nr:M42 family peptidase [Solobacterium sp.]
SGGGTNAAMVNKQFGVPAIVISVPVRYIHSSYCWMSEKDYEAAVELCLAIIKELNEDVIKGF